MRTNPINEYTLEEWTVILQTTQNLYGVRRKTIKYGIIF